jgi:polyisoprenoid-binding protein YceI/hemerythrin-like domain-containing protein
MQSTSQAVRERQDSIAETLADGHAQLQRSFADIVELSFDLDTDELRQPWKKFEVGLIRHLDLEEEHVLRPFAAAEPGPAAEILAEHKRVRAALTQLGIDLDLHSLRPEQVQTFVEQLRAHVAREESLIYPWAARQLGAEARTRLRRALQEYESHIGELARPPILRIDPSRSTLGFTLRHVVIRELVGHFSRWGGMLSVNETEPSTSWVRIWVDIASIDTGDVHRDEYVRSPGFFNVERFPRAVFSSSDVRVPDGGNPLVKGRLRMHGHLADLTLEVTSRRMKVGEHGEERAVYIVNGHIDRQQFGLHWRESLDRGGFLVGDEIQIAAYVEAVRAVPRHPTE